jgi:hypothetical protein
MFFRSRLCRLVMVALLLGGCAAAPVQTMSDTRQTIKAAEAAGAADVAPQPLAAARDALKRAEDLIAAHDYRGAGRAAAAARQSAAEALAATQRHGSSN